MYETRNLEIILLGSGWAWSYTLSLSSRPPVPLCLGLQRNLWLDYNFQRRTSLLQVRLGP